MHRPVPLTKDLVFVGGGHTHALVLRAFGMAPVPGARLTLIDPGVSAPYTGMLPGHIAGHYARSVLEIDLLRLARFAGARFIQGAASGVDTAARTVTVPGRPPVRYDHLSIDIGIHSALRDLPGFDEHAIAVKPLDRFATRWASLCEQIAAQGVAPDIAVIGGGIAGAEIALAMAHRIRTLGARATIHVIDSAEDPLGRVAPAVRRNILAAFARYDITQLNGSAPVAVSASGVDMANGAHVPAGFVLSAAGARPYAWLESTGLPLVDGFLKVDDQLRVAGQPRIFAAGDCAYLSASPRPKAGVFAVRAAPILHHNLRADLTGRARRVFRPQRDFLKLISLGERSAVGERFGLVRAGPTVWRWKDRIDRRFMEQFSTLKPMQPPPPPPNAARGVAEVMQGQPPCLGCGAKLAQSTLLPGIESHAPTAGDDAALITLGEHTLALTTDHLPAFIEDPLIFARIAATHALGDLWATGARPTGALVNLILPRMAPDMAQATLAEVMQGLAEVLSAAGAPILGGHTTFGSELTLGVTLLGDAEAPKQLSGAQAGDALILTKPIGSGTILAADMALKAHGADVAACLSLMQQSQARAADMLGAASAMTDVTGFGLAGHLVGIVRASRVSARIELASVPFMPGALDLAEAGLRSTLYPDNRASVPEAHGPASPRADLLFDPQTAGGLLASVPEAGVAKLLENLKDAGYTAARIGDITAGPPSVSWTG